MNTVLVSLLNLDDALKEHQKRQYHFPLNCASTHDKKNCRQVAVSFLVFVAATRRMETDNGREFDNFFGSPTLSSYELVPSRIDRLVQAAFGAATGPELKFAEQRAEP